jgi:putative spermidine/putrescine transport system permease protein
MFLVMMPAVMGLKNSWREAAAIMGASPARYWWSVGIPLLTPSTLGGMLLLFINAFTAYATVYVLNPSGALVPLQIRFLLQGNVITGEEDLAYAIVAWVILLLLTGLGLITVMQRRTLRWSSQ